MAGETVMAFVDVKGEACISAKRPQLGVGEVADRVRPRDRNTSPRVVTREAVMASPGIRTNASGGVGGEDSCEDSGSDSGSAFVYSLSRSTRKAVSSPNVLQRDVARAVLVRAARDCLVL